MTNRQSLAFGCLLFSIFFAIRSDASQSDQMAFALGVLANINAVLGMALLLIDYIPRKS